MIDKPIYDHAGWRNRGYLPHCDAAGAIQHIVFGLADALPKRVVDSLPVRPEGRVEIADAALDNGHGALLLRADEAAEIVESVLLHEDERAYRLIAWCVMPNHVHVLAEQIKGFRLEEVVQKWKSVSSHRVNRLLGRKGALWRREYFDRYMRTDEQLISTRDYIERNPVAAGLVALPENWRFSSASRRP